MDVRQSPQYAKFMQALGWQVEKIGQTQVFFRHLPIFSFWSVCKVQRFDSLDLKKLEALCQKHHTLFVKIEPNTKYEILDTKYSLDCSPLLPTKTIILNLKTPHFPEVLKRAKKFHLKTEIIIRTLRQTQGKQKSKDPSKKNLLSHIYYLQSFVRFWHQNAKDRHFFAPLQQDITAMFESFAPNSFLFLTKDGDKILSGILLVTHQKTAHYFFAFSTPEGRKKWAAYVCLADAIKFLQKKGIEKLDFEGVFDERFPNMRRDWQGFTEFKKRWGGEEKDYPQGSTKHFNWFTKVLFLLEKIY